MGPRTVITLPAMFGAFAVTDVSSSPQYPCQDGGEGRGWGLGKAKDLGIR